jgi:hypothetical protein
MTFMQQPDIFRCLQFEKVNFQPVKIQTKWQPKIHMKHDFTPRPWTLLHVSPIHVIKPKKQVYWVSL